MSYLAFFKAKLAAVILTFLCEDNLNGMFTYNCQPPGGTWTSPTITTDLRPTKMSSPGENVFFGGLLSEDLDYTLVMSASVSARQGHWVLVPCEFTFPRQASSEELHGYWFKKEPGNRPSFHPGPLVATSDKKAAVDTSAANRFRFVGDPNQGDCSFSINDTQWQDEGNYCFRIQQGSLKYTYVNNSNRIHTSPFIVVLGSPSVVKILANTTSHGKAALCSREAKGDVESVVAREGESISLHCKAEGRPDPTLSWAKGGKTLNGSREGKEHSLLLLEVKPEDAGEYQCRAETPYGSANQTLRLCVQYAPRLSSTRPNSTCRHEGSGLFCSCSLHSWPPPRIQWQVDGETINESSPGEALRVTFQARGNERSSILTWTRSPNGDHSITCFATSPSGAYTLQFVRSSSITSAHPSLLLSALCGPLITASLFLLGTCLTRLWKQKKVSSHSEGQQAPNNGSEVYGNIMILEGVTPSFVLQDPVSRYSGIYNNLQPPESITYSSVLPE